MANDGVCDGSDLQHLLLDADKVEAQPLAALDGLSLHPATPRRSTLRADANGPITRSCASRQREVVHIIPLAHGLASVVRVFADMGVIGQTYAYESAATAGPLVQVERTLTTAAPRPGPRRSLSPGPGYPPTAPPSRGCGAPSGPPPARPPPRMTSLRPGQRGGARPRAPPTRRASRRQAASSPFRRSSSRSTDPALGRACVPRQPCMRSPCCPCAWCAGHPLRPWPGRCRRAAAPQETYWVPAAARRTASTSGTTTAASFASPRRSRTGPGSPALDSHAPSNAPRGAAARSATARCGPAVGRWGAGRRWAGGTQSASVRERQPGARGPAARPQRHCRAPLVPPVVKYTPCRDPRPPESCLVCLVQRSHFGSEGTQRPARVSGKAPPGRHLEGHSAVRNPAHWDGYELTAAARADW